MENQERGGKKIRIIAGLILLALLVFAGWRVYSGLSGSGKADRVMKKLYEIVPDLDIDTGESKGAGSDPLAAISIEGVDIVGVIEIPSLDIIAPVTGKNFSEEYFAS